MDRSLALPFRDGNLLATRFTGTLSERYGGPIERLPTPERLDDWLSLNGLQAVGSTPDDLAAARDLREAIHLAATADAKKTAVPRAARDALNQFSAGGDASCVLREDGAQAWFLRSGSVNDALSVIAADAILLVSGERPGRLALCASPTCRAAFLDTSQSRSRRWCDMNSCGNKQKKARYFAKASS